MRPGFHVVEGQPGGVQQSGQDFAGFVQLAMLVDIYLLEGVDLLAHFVQGFLVAVAGFVQIALEAGGAVVRLLTGLAGALGLVLQILAVASCFSQAQRA